MGYDKKIYLRVACQVTWLCFKYFIAEFNAFL